MKNISQAQKKIVFITAGVILLFVVAGIFAYIPATRTIIRLKSELDAANAQINEIESLVGKGGVASKQMQDLYKEYKRVDSKFPEKEEKALEMLSDIAQKIGIEITSIKSNPKFTLLDKDQQKIEIEGKVCKCIAVSVEMSSGFSDLVKYIEALNESLPAYMTIGRSIIRRSPGAVAALSVSVDINIYLLS